MTQQTIDMHFGDMPEEATKVTQPMHVKCADCSHKWVGMYLPQPISTAARILKNLTCPKCGAGSNRILASNGENHG